MYIWKIRLSNGKEFNVVTRMQNRTDVWNKLVFKYDIKEVTFVSDAHMID